MAAKPRSEYRAARRNVERSSKAQTLKLMRQTFGFTRSEQDFTRHLHPNSWRVWMLVTTQMEAAR